MNLCLGRQGRNKKSSRAAKRKRILKNEGSLRDLWDNMRHNNICITGVTEGEEREQYIENLFEKLMIETSLTW